MRLEEFLNLTAYKQDFFHLLWKSLDSLPEDEALEVIDLLNQHEEQFDFYQPYMSSRESRLYAHFEKIENMTHILGVDSPFLKKLFNHLVDCELTYFQHYGTAGYRDYDSEGYVRERIYYLSEDQLWNSLYEKNILIEYINDRRHEKFISHAAVREFAFSDEVHNPVFVKAYHILSTLEQNPDNIEIFIDLWQHNRSVILMQPKVRGKSETVELQVELTKFYQYKDKLIASEKNEEDGALLALKGFNHANKKLEETCFMLIGNFFIQNPEVYHEKGQGLLPPAFVFMLNAPQAICKQWYLKMHEPHFFHFRMHNKNTLYTELIDSIFDLNTIRNSKNNSLSREYLEVLLAHASSGIETLFPGRGYHNLGEVLTRAQQFNQDNHINFDELLYLIKKNRLEELLPEKTEKIARRKI